MNLCDFCSAPAPAWRYPATTFTDLWGSRSIEDWLACEVCHELIVADDRDALARRFLNTESGRRAALVMGRAAAFSYCRNLHDRFWLARRGDPYRIAA
jgi:hypothetical protein